jgi:hypothetical protein
LGFLILIVITGTFKYYDDSAYVKAEYNTNCPQNNGDPVSLDRCYIPQRLAKETLEKVFKAEILGLFIVPLIIYTLSII